MTSFPLFPQAVIDAAKEAHKKYGVFASVSLAQWALESNYGFLLSGENNPFGIKAVRGEPGRDVITHEFIHGRYLRMPQTFKNFASISEAFDYHAHMLAVSHYYEEARRARTPQGFAEKLTGVYATDPKYGDKLIRIMDLHDLYKYDV